MERKALMKPCVLLAADTYYPKADGVLIFMQEFIKRAEVELKLHLLVPQFSTLRPFRETGITFLDLSSRGLFTYQSIRISRKNRRKIRKAVQHADIVFVQELGPVGFLALRYARKYGKKAVFYVHNLPWEFMGKYYGLRKFSLALLKKFFVHYYNHSTLLLVPYPELEAELRQAGVKVPIRSARLGVDIDRFFPPKDKAAAKAALGLPQKPVVGYVGRITSEKNPLVLLEAFRKLKYGAPGKGKHDVFLLMVGDGKKELVEKFTMLPDCKVTGFVKDVENYLQAMDIFVLPSLTETTSLATLEAMAAGLPVVVTPVGFLKKYLIKDYNGMFFPKKSPSLLAAKLEKLLLDRVLREKLGQKARKTVAYSFSWERSVNKIKKFMVEMAQ